MTKENSKKNIVIFGDSYSTFAGYIPENYATYYSTEWRESTDVRRVEETWWKQFVTAIDGNLLLNNSWSGSTIGYTGYNGSDCSQTSSFLYRFKKLLDDGYFEENKVDLFIVFGGTNDSWSNAPLGELKYAERTEEDLFCVLPAICHLASELTTRFPNAKIVFLVNTGIKEEIRSALQSVAKHYGADALVLQELRKACGHPTVTGMKDIYEQLLAWYNQQENR